MIAVLGYAALWSTGLYAGCHLAASGHPLLAFFVFLITACVRVDLT